MFCQTFTMAEAKAENHLEKVVEDLRDQVAALVQVVQQLTCDVEELKASKAVEAQGSQDRVSPKKVPSKSEPSNRTPQSSSSEVDTSSDSSSPDRDLGRRKRKQKATSPRTPDSGRETQNPVELVRLANILKADRKETPKPEVFSLESDRSWRAFLRSFESYASSRYGADTKAEWTRELGNFLSGEIKSVFDVAGGSERPYPAVVLELKDYVKQQEKCSGAKRHHEFQQAIQLPEEPLRVYAVRLARLFMRAFPKQDLQHNSALLYKFMSSIPVADAERLQERMHLMQQFGVVKEFTWQKLLDLIQPDSYAAAVKSPPSTPPRTPVWVGSGARPKGPKGRTRQ